MRLVVYTEMCYTLYCGMVTHYATGEQSSMLKIGLFTQGLCLTSHFQPSYLRLANPM